MNGELNIEISGDVGINVRINVGINVGIKNASEDGDFTLFLVITDALSIDDY